MTTQRETIIEFTGTNLSGLLRIRPYQVQDCRGTFTKLFHEPSFASHGLVTTFSEFYYSCSNRDVVRGMHFQVPPLDQAKLVTCLTGRSLDVVVDIRMRSRTYGEVFIGELDALSPEALYIPPGFAHGFLALEDRTTLAYLASSAYSKEHDAGILWNSIGPAWPEIEAITSERDRSFPTLAEFRSPF